MAAINQLVVREAVSQLTKRRKNWAAREPGVVLVFCIVFVVAVGVIALMISKACKARREKKLSGKP